jgi:hypothetical protein
MSMPIANFSPVRRSGLDPRPDVRNADLAFAELGTRVATQLHHALGAVDPPPGARGRSSLLGRFILSGSCDAVIGRLAESFDLVVFILTPTPLRLTRLRQREQHEVPLLPPQSTRRLLDFSNSTNSRTTRSR